MTSVTTSVTNIVVPSVTASVTASVTTSVTASVTASVTTSETARVTISVTASVTASVVASVYRKGPGSAQKRENESELFFLEPFRFSTVAGTGSHHNVACTVVRPSGSITRMAAVIEPA